MISEAIITAAAERLAAIDVSAENARIAEQEAEIQRLAAARARASARLQEMLETPILTGAEVADALLEDGDALELGRQSREEVENERASVRAGIAELDRRQQAARAAISAEREAARRKTAAALVPLVDAMEEEARTAADAIKQCLSAAEALNAAFGSGVPRGLRQTVTEGMTMPGGLVSPLPADVPNSIAKLVTLRAGMGSAMERRPYG